MTHTTQATLAVIVPIYNVESYLQECLESIAGQINFSQLQVILVNDGSSDASPEIAQEFVVKHSNALYLSQPNQGPGAARNLGLEAVSADFVTFLDSDDRVPNHAYSDLMKGMENPEVNVAVGKMASFPKNRTFIWDAAFKNGTRTISGITEQSSLIHSASAGNKVFRMDGSGFATLRFPLGVHFEDAMVVLPLLIDSPRIYVVNRVVYEYRKRDVGGSIMDSVFERPANYFDYLDLVEHLSDCARRLTSKKRMIVEEFIVRGMRGFVKRAPEKLTEAELASFNNRAYVVVSQLDLGVVENFSNDPPHRLAFANLLARGEGAVPVETQIEIVGDSAYDGFVGGRKDNNLRRASRVVPSIESISAQDLGTMVIEGRVDFRGLSADEKPRADVGISLGHRRFEGEWKTRADRVISGGFWSGFQVSIPIEDWPVGEYFPRVWIESAKGSVEARANKTIGFFKSAKPMFGGGKSFELFANQKNQIGVITRRIRKGVQPKEKLRELYAAFKDYRAGRAFALKRILMIVSRPFFRKEIWIIGERWNTAQDNGAALFKYVSENEPAGVEAYYAVEKGTAAYTDMSAVGRVVAMGSIKHLLLLLNASRLINAFDVDTFSIPRSWTAKSFVENLLPYMRTKRVFLQHGVTYRNIARGVHRLIQAYDLVITTSENEREYFENDLDYGDRAVVTGFPRFDSLRPAVDKSSILFAPTWRHNLATPSYSKAVVQDGQGIEASRYYQEISKLLGDEKLQESLKKHNCSIRFLPHYEVAKCFIPGQFGDWVEIVDQGITSFQSELNRASMLITDYSSTFFDMAYAGKPVIYFNHDEQEFEISNPSLDRFSLEAQGFGPCCPTVGEVVEGVTKYLETGFKREEIYSARVTEFFAAIDRDNSKRVVDEICRL